MFGDNIVIRNTSASEYKYGKFGDIRSQFSKMIGNGIVVDYCGDVVLEF
jgi:hypothetical protein